MFDTCLGLFNRAARSPQGPGTNSTMDESKSESKTTTNGKETSDIDKWKSESRAKANGQVANEHRTDKPEKDTKTAPRDRTLTPRRLQMAPQGAKNGPKKGRRGCKNDPKPQVEPRSAPRLLQDRPGSSPGGESPTFPPPIGVHLGVPKRPKPKPKTIQNAHENRESKKSDPRRSRTRLGAILVALGPPCGSPKTPKVLENALFRTKSLFRR